MESGDAYVRVESYNGKKRISLEPSFVTAALFSQLTGTAATNAVFTVGGSSICILGPDQADQIGDALLVYDVVCLMPGTYSLSAPFLITSNKTLIAPWGQASIVPTWAPIVGDADARTNYVIGVISTMSVTATTLGATMKCGSRTLTLVSTTGLVANDWLYLSGHNGAGDEQLMSDGASIIVRELVQVASVDSGTVVTLKSRTRQHHATGKSVTKVASLVQNVTIRGISVRAPGGTIGCGIIATASRDVWVEEFEIEGLSRAGIDMLGCEDSHIEWLYSHGEVNSWMRLESCIGISWSEFRGTDNGLREHANGKPKALVDLRGRCKFIRGSDAHFIRGNFAYRDWGSHFSGFVNASCEDMDCAAALARDTEFTAGGNVAGGFAWDGGAGDVPTWASFGLGAYCDNYSIDAASSGSADAAVGAQMQIYLHDHFSVAFSNIAILNRGTSYELTPTKYVAGIDMRDCSGSITNLTISGVYNAISTRNVYASIRAVNVALLGAPGTAPSGSWAYVMGAAGGLGSEVEFDGLIFSNWFGSEFKIGAEATTATTDWNLNWRNVNFDGYRFEYITIARNTGTAFTTGQVGMADDAASAATGATARMITTPTANARNVYVVAKQDGTWCLVAPLPQICTVGVTGAVTLGGMLAATTNRDLAATATLADACARATRKLTATGVILVGGV